MKFTTTIAATGKNTTGIEVPVEVVTALGKGKSPLVTVRLNGFSYPSKIASMGGRLLIPVSAEIREKAGVAAGETHEIEVVPDEAPRVIEPPAELAAALAGDPTAQAAWDKLSPSHRKQHALAIDGAKGADTKAKRVAKAIEMLRGG